MLYEVEFPETRNGANQHTRVRHYGEGSADRFTKAAAEISGNGERTIPVDNRNEHVRDWSSKGRETVMLEGQYSAVFYEAESNSGQTGDEFARGVVEFRDGEVFGGDSGYYYRGKYEMLDAGRFRAQITIAPHALQPKFDSLFGVRGMAVLIEGSVNHAGIQCGAKIGPRGNPMHVRLSRLPTAE